MNILEILKSVVMPEVLREQLKLEQAKAELKQTQTDMRLEASETRVQVADMRTKNAEAERDKFKLALETEQKNHDITRKQLAESNAQLAILKLPPGNGILRQMGVPKLKSIT